MTSTSVAALPSVFHERPVWDHGHVPEWFAMAQREAWEAFLQAPVEGRKDEAWRFAVAGLLPVEAVTVPPPAAVPAIVALSATAARVTTVNDRLLSGENNGFEVLDLTTALERYPDKLRPLLTGLGTGLGSARYAALHTARLRLAAVIVVPAGVHVEAPIEIVHWLSGEKAAGFPRTIILAGENARVTVVEHHCTEGDAPAYCCSAAQLVAETGASIDLVQINRQNAGSRALHMTTLHCGEASRVRHTIFNLGAADVRTESLNVIAGKESRSEMLSVSLASPNQEVDQRTLQDHQSAHSYSDLLYKNVLFGNARTVFAGLIKVAQGAHYTDAYQKCRNLLLTDECEANSMPGLEINADQVKCSHGSTSSRINDEELFYLKARGIKPSTAAHLISMGFAADVVERLEHPALRAYITEMIAERFAQLGEQAA